MRPRGSARPRDAPTHHGRFAALVPDEQVVRVVELETAYPALQGEMTDAILLRDAGAGTEVIGRHDGLPPGAAPAGNELGWRMALDKLAALVEAARALPRP